MNDLKEVLAQHQSAEGGCACGWEGDDHTDHVIDMVKMEGLMVVRP